MRKTVLILCALLYCLRPLSAEIVHDCPNIPFCCPGPGNYPAAPAHGTGCALTVAAMALPFILIGGIAAIILATSEPTHTH